MKNKDKVRESERASARESQEISSDDVAAAVAVYLYTQMRKTCTYVCIYPYTYEENRL